MNPSDKALLVDLAKEVARAAARGIMRRLREKREKLAHWNWIQKTHVERRPWVLEQQKQEKP